MDWQAGSAAPLPIRCLAPVAVLLYVLMIINIWLAVFNLIPVPPLDAATCCAIFCGYSAKGVRPHRHLRTTGVGVSSARSSQQLDRPACNLYRLILVKF